MFSLFGYFGMPGPLEMFVIALVVLLLFGNRLPGVMRSMGRGIVEFKKGIQGIEEDVDNAVNQADQPPKNEEEQLAKKWRDGVPK